MANMHLDMSEVQEFAADLGRVPQELSRHAIPVLKRFAQDTKAEIQDDMRASSNGGFRQAANFVSYDEISDGATGFETEVGFDKSGAGNLANLAVYGSSRGGGTHPAPHELAEKHFPAFERAVGDIAEELLS